jgi:hypothetical protein
MEQLWQVVIWEPEETGRSFGVRSWYVEVCWAPVLGPSALLMLRRLAARLEQGPATVDLGELAAEIGLGAQHPARAAKVVGRLVRFGVARWEAPGVLGLRVRLPAVSGQGAARLSPAARAVHDQAVGRPSRSSRPAAGGGGVA